MGRSDRDNRIVNVKQGSEAPQHSLLVLPRSIALNGMLNSSA